jgi:hypothetical protein
MEIPMQVKVTGLKASQGEYEGTAYDSTKVYVETQLDDSKGKASGTATVEYSYMTSAEYAKLMAQGPLPFMADAVLQIVTSGKVQKTMLKDGSLVVKQTIRKAA